jgi:formate--tetrahydrofolate ligase
MHGGVAKTNLTVPDAAAVLRGGANLAKHVANVRQFGVPVIVAVNIFPTDTQEELAAVTELCHKLDVQVALSDVWARGGDGGIELAKQVIALADSGKSQFAPLYPNELSLNDKVRAVATKVYGADDVVFTKEAAKSINELERMGYGQLPVCIAKTQYSFSDDPALLGRPEGFKITVRQAKVSAGAGFVVMLTGDIMTMPGLPKAPAAEKIDVDSNGKITGLF